MAYDEQEIKRSKVVVEAPTAHREVIETARTYRPERSGLATTAVAALTILALAVIGLVGVLFWTMRSNSEEAARLAAQQQPTPQVVVQQPAQQPPVIVQQPAPASQPPVVINAPAPASAPGANTPAGLDDAVVQTAVDTKLQGDSTLSTLDVTATVVNGKVLLAGSVKSLQLKDQVEKAVRSIKGVQSVDNQLSIISS